MSRQPGFYLMIAVFFGVVIPTAVLAEITEANKPEITLQVTTEENQKTILATVTAGGKPLKGATVAFSVKRTFGNLDIGHDQTLDDGTAAVPFPVDLPGGTTGQINVIAVISDPPQYSSVRNEATFGDALVIGLQTEEFPRALWAPQAPLALIMIIVIVVTWVWGTYIYVVFELVKIRKGGV
jgi:hypothetical protein